jgi:hypothetical protein
MQEMEQIQYKVKICLKRIVKYQALIQWFLCNRNKKLAYQ